MNDNGEYPFGHTIAQMDMVAFENARDWLRKAVEAAGARCTGSGIGMGQADIDVVLDGGRFNITIRPLLGNTKPAP